MKPWSQKVSPFEDKDIQTKQFLSDCAIRIEKISLKVEDYKSSQNRQLGNHEALFNQKYENNDGKIQFSADYLTNTSVQNKLCSPFKEHCRSRTNKKALKSYMRLFPARNGKLLFDATCKVNHLATSHELAPISSWHFIQHTSRLAFSISKISFLCKKITIWKCFYVVIWYAILSHQAFFLWALFYSLTEESKCMRSHLKSVL